MVSKFENHIKNYNINFVPMELHGKKIIFMKQPRSAGTAIWGHTLKPYIRSIGEWSGGQGCNNIDDKSKNWFKKITDEEIKNEYFIFTFVRNPFSRVVSCWGEGKRNVRGMKCSSNFEFFIKNELWREDRDDFKGFHNAHLIPANIHSEYDDGELFTNYVGKIENIEEDWKTLCDIIYLPYSKLPHVYSGHSVEESYKNFYTSELTEIVSNYYKRDLELFGYEF
tara:strand:- start:1840 stop:2511 length:672 start_codon:yes stop_codon:yes gene_type:complete